MRKRKSIKLMRNEEDEAMKGLKEIRSRFEFSLDNRQVVLIISGVIMVLMLSFLMGTLFGKNLGAAAVDKTQVAANDAPAPADNPGPDPAADDQPVPANDQPAADKSAAAAGHEEPAEKRAAYIRELESMKLDSPPATDGANSAAGPQPTTPDAPAGEQTPAGGETPTLANLAPDHEHDSIVQMTKDKPAKPKSPELVAPKPDDKLTKDGAKNLKPLTTGAYTLQLASLPDKAEANGTLRDLRNRGWEAYMLEVTIPDKGTFYRVRVGHYETLEQAKKALTIIQSREGKFFDAWVTQ
jgi:DedD protein